MSTLSHPHPRVESAAAFLAQSLREQATSLRRWEADVRLGEAPALHRYRIATRRLRSTLSAFEPLFRGGAAKGLAQDLGGVARTMGGGRDSEIVRSRLESLLTRAGVAGGLAAVPVLDGRLEHSRTEGAGATLGMFDSPDYDRVVRRLESFVDLPPWSKAASEPAAETLRPLLASEWTRFRRRARLVQVPVEHEDDPRLHDARKAAKRVRYVAEELEPLFGRKSGRMAKAAERVQVMLGDERDSMLTRQLLREFTAGSVEDQSQRMVLVRLLALENVEADLLHEQIPERLAAADRKSLRRWLRAPSVTEEPTTGS